MRQSVNTAALTARLQRICCRFQKHQAGSRTRLTRSRSTFDSRIDEQDGAPFITSALHANPGRLDSGSPIEVAIKDNIATKDSTTTAASGILETYQSPYNASIVEWYQDRMDILVRKTNMDEFGMGSHSQYSHFGPLFYKGHSAGGSSGGSAVAVAQGSAEFGIGTDTGGSIRLPASYTGTFGFKPSYGVISRFGVVPYANSLDTVGLLTKTISLLKELFGQDFMIEHTDPRDPTCMTRSSRERFVKRNGEASGYWRSHKQFKRLRVGVPAEYNVAELTAPVKRAWNGSLRALQDAGHQIVPISLPSTRHALSAYYILAAAEAASNLSKYDGVRYGTRAKGPDAEGDVLYSKTRGSGFGEEVKRRILLGSYTLSSAAIDNYFIQAQKIRRLVQKDFDRVFALSNPLKDEEQFDLSEMSELTVLENKLGPAQVDIIVCPTAPNLPPSQSELSDRDPILDYTTDVFTVPASLAGLPAISVPVPITEGSDETTGIQIIGQYWDDQLVLHAAATLSALMHPGLEQHAKQS